MMTISEGATMVGGEMVHAGEADAYGHRKLGGIGQVTGEAAQRDRPARASSTSRSAT